MPEVEVSFPTCGWRSGALLDTFSILAGVTVGVKTHQEPRFPFACKPRGTRTRNLWIKSPAKGVFLVVGSVVWCGFVSAWWWGVVANSAPFAARFAAQSRPVAGTADCGGCGFRRFTAGVGG